MVPGFKREDKIGRGVLRENEGAAVSTRLSFHSPEAGLPQISEGADWALAPVAAEETPASVGQG